MEMRVIIESRCCVGSFFFFFSSRRRHTRYWRDWSSDVCSSDLGLTSNIFPEDEFSSQQEQQHPGIPNGGEPEVSDQIGRASCRERV